MVDSIVLSQPKWGNWCSRYCFVPQRHLLSLMGFILIINCYATRMCLPHAITVLVIKRDIAFNATPFDSYRYCARDDTFDLRGKYDWSQIVQGFSLSSFYIGYMVTTIPGALLSDRFGGKWILTLGILMSGLSSFVTPSAIEMGGSDALIGTRVFMGLGQGLVFPSLSGMICNWVPWNERGVLGGIIIAAGVLGSFIGNILSGVFLALFHWSVPFRVFGALSLIWCPFFLIFCFSYPATHPCITRKEILYLNEQMGNLGHKVMRPIPWVDIITSGPFYALIFVQVGHDWGMSLIVNDLPKYYSEVQGFGVLANGLVTSVPFLIYGIIGIIFGYLGDCVLRNDYMSVTHLRKLMTVIAAWGPALLMICGSYAGCHRLFVIILFACSLGTMGPYFTGMKITPMDLSPNYAEYIVGISNTFGSIAGFLAPTTTAFLIPDSNMYQWRLVFWLGFAVLFFTAIVFLLYGSGEIQPYDDPEYQRPGKHA